MKIFKVIYLIVCVICIYMIATTISNNNNNNEIESISKELIEVKEGKLSSENEGKLVMITGNPTVNNDMILSDSEFGISVKDAVVLHRNVKQYRYNSSIETEVQYKKHKKYKYDTETERYYENDKVVKSEEKIYTSWTESVGQDEEEIGKYKNPKSLIESMYFYKPIHLGDFELELEKIEEFLDYKYYNELSSGTHNILGDYKAIINNDITYITNTIEEPEIGDYNINFGTSNFKENTTFTIVGKQTGNKIEPYTYEDIVIDKVFDTNMSKEDVLNTINQDLTENNAEQLAMYSLVLIIGIFVFKKDIKKFLKKSKNKEVTKI